MARIYWKSSSSYTLELVNFGYVNVASGGTGSATSYRVDYFDNTSDRFGGKGFDFTSSGLLTSGTVKTFTAVDFGQTTVKITGLKLKASSVAKAMKTESTTDDYKLLRKALSGDDALFGGRGNDYIKGYEGNDKIKGGLGADVLYGGSGRDKFVYTSIHQSGVSLPDSDTILDFTKRDKIDLKRIDAKEGTRRNDKFDFIGSKAFSGDKGELRYQKLDSGTVIQGDVNGDGRADFAIYLDDRMTMKESYFIL